MVTITKKQFLDLCDKGVSFQAIEWAWLIHPEAPLKKFAEVARESGLDDHDVQYIIWKFDTSGWVKALDGNYTVLVENYLNE